MSKKVDIQDAPNWSDKEAEDNLRYLRQRGRDKDAKKVEDLRKETSGSSGNGGSSGSGSQGGSTSGGSETELFPGFDTQPEKDTVEAILAWVGDDGDKAEVARAAELAKDKPRPTLTDKLEEDFEFETKE